MHADMTEIECPAESLLNSPRRFNIVSYLIATALLLTLAPLSMAASDQATELKLDSGWKFKPGDELQRAQLDFDDRSWKPIKVPGYWNRAGFTTPDGFGWYRNRVKLPPGRQPLELIIKGLAGEDETYFNGRLIGKTGNFSGDFSNPKYVIRNYIIPSDLVKSENVIAIRVFAGQTVWGGGIIRPVLLRPLSPDRAVAVNQHLQAGKFFFAPGEKIDYSIDCTNRWPGPQPFKLESTLTDVTGKVLSRFSTVVNLPANARKSWKQTIVLPRIGLYIINSEIVVADRTRNSISTKIGIIPERSNNISLDPRFGVASHLNWWDSKTVLRLLDLMRRAGIGTARTGMIWSEIELQKGQFDFTRSDMITRETAKRGITYLPTVSDVPSWAVASKSSNQTSKIPRQEDWQRFITAIFKRYSNDIKIWEMGNEPNLNKLSPIEYRDLYTAAYTAAKQVDPDSIIAIGGLSSVHVKSTGRIMPNTYLNSLYESGLIFDAIAYHPYIGWPKTNTAIAEDFASTINGIEQVLTTHAQRNKKLYLTEYSTSVRPDQGRTELDQARFLVITSVTALTFSNVAKLCWYNLRNKGENPEDNEMNYGLLNFDLSPKTAFMAYWTMINQLEFLNYEGRYDGAPKVSGYFFGNGKRLVLVIWSDSEPRQLELPNAIAVTDLTGTSLQITTGKIEVSMMPQYITLSK